MCTAPSIVSQSPSHTNLLLLEPPCAPTVMGKKLRLLIVDDAAMCRKMTARVLSQHFSVCDEADDGASAVEMVKRAVLACTPYDVVGEFIRCLS